MKDQVLKGVSELEFSDVLRELKERKLPTDMNEISNIFPRKIECKKDSFMDDNDELNVKWCVWDLRKGKGVWEKNLYQAMARMLLYLHKKKVLLEKDRTLKAYDKKRS